MGKISLRTRIGNFLRRKEKSAYFWKVRQGALEGNPLGRVVNWFRYRRLMLRHNADIPLSAEFGGPPVFPHGLSGVFVSAGAKLGKGCVIFQQVTIGSNTLRDSGGKGTPVIGDEAYIGAGAKIIGGVHVGNRVRVGANCVVTRDVPDNSTVVLERPRVIVREGAQDNTFVGVDEILGQE